MGHAEQIHSSHGSGIFLPFDGNKQVKFSKIVYEDETRDAYIYEHFVKMKNGSHYKASEVQPKKRKVNVVNERTPAWTTSHNKGHEKYIAFELAKIGVANICISPQQNITKIGNMTKSAHDYIEITRHLAGNRGLDPNRATIGGSSRGEMYANAVSRLAPEHNFAIDYREGSGGAMPRGLRLNKVPSAGRKLLKEPGRLLHIVLNNPLEATAMLIDTPARNLGEAAQQAKEVVTLLDGSTGEHAENMPPETFGVDTQFIDDGLADGEEWPGIFDPYSNMYLHVLPGTHMDCVSPQMVNTTVNRLRFIRDGYLSGAIGSQALHDMVAVGNPAFQTAQPFYPHSLAS